MRAPNPVLRVTGAILALLLIAGVAGACGDDDEDDEAAATEEATPEEEATEEAGSPTEAASEEATQDEEGLISLRAGLNDPEDVNIAILEYLPESITVATGTTVRWEIAGPEPHSVTFFPEGEAAPPPGSDPALFAPTPLEGDLDGSQLVNSGLVGDEPTQFELPFNVAGDFSYLCIIHPLMTGTVSVVDSGAESQEEIDARGEEELEPWLEEGRAAKEALLANQVRSEANPDGTTTWYIEMGATTEHTDVLAFAPPDLDVAAGDSVVFVNNSLAPHSTVFLNGNEFDGALDPAVPGPSPQTLNSADLYNTGTLPPNAPPGGGPPEAVRSYTFVVAEAGTYDYICTYHATSGMQGAITSQ